jgi:hypothetical protein
MIIRFLVDHVIVYRITRVHVQISIPAVTGITQKENRPKSANGEISAYGIR